MSRATELADKLNSLCVAEFAWTYLNDAATELRRLTVESEMRRALAEEAMQDNNRLYRVNAELATALQRISDMRDREGNAIEMHRDELRGIARAALTSGEQL